MEIYKNDYFILNEESSSFYITIIKSGFDVNSINDIFAQFPRLEITDFMNLIYHLKNGDPKVLRIGVYKPVIEIITTPDYMSAYFLLNISQQSIDTNRESFKKDIIHELREKGIIYGIKLDVLDSELIFKKKTLIAEGQLPIDGHDAVIKYIEMPSFQPRANEDGSVDNYDVDLFREVKKGDCLGQKILSTQGTNGTNVKGEVLNSRPGKDKLLRYDDRTVDANINEDKVTLLAKKDGVVEFRDGKLSVIDHLMISGDVNFGTGNIEYIGYVTVKGTVQDGFSIVADKDISVLGQIGIGAIDKIISKLGRVYVK